MTSDNAAWFAQRFAAIRDNVSVVLRGKDPQVRLALACLMAEGHLLIEDVPGVGKTSLARAIAASIDATWQRIQFTPDLLPSDVTGVSIYRQATQSFEFAPGPVFANIVVADEINRASPKTQSALLEVMEERHVTVDGHPHPVPRPFTVVATQNPIEMDGTYRLPEAQIDRFLVRLEMGYPDRASEMDILRSRRAGIDVESLRPVVSPTEVRAMIAYATGVDVSPGVQDYIVRLCEATRRSPSVRLGASPRGSLALQRVSCAWAASEGRSFVTPEDVKRLAVAVLAHRLILTPEAELQGLGAASVVGGILEQTAVPQALAGA